MKNEEMEITMKKTLKTFLVIALALSTSLVLAQGMGGGHNGGGAGHGGGMGGNGGNGGCDGDSTGYGWGGGMHDSLDIVTVSGVVYIDSVEMDMDHDSSGYGHQHGSHGAGEGYQNGHMASNQMQHNLEMNDRDTTLVRLVYALDVDADGITDYILNFGPPWYVPEDTTLTRPEAGETITVTGYLMTESMMWEEDVIIVAELNGQPWRDVGSGMFGFNRRAPEGPVVEIANHRNFPNPFNPSTTISFQIVSSARVQVTIHDILGRKVATLMNTYATPGTYQVQWQGRNEAGRMVASGLYLYRISTGSQSVTRMINFLK